MKNIVKFLLIFTFLFSAINFVSAQGIVNAPRDGSWDKTHVTNRKMVPYQYIREADVTWSKRIWRTVDFREKMNFSFLYPVSPMNGRKNFMLILWDAIKEGTITPYEFDPNGDDTFETPITYDQIKKDLEKERKIVKVNEETMENYDSTYTETFDPSSVKQLKIKEDWFFDRNRGVLEVRIIGICPVTQEFDDNGDVKGYKSLFWIYFPEVRPVFAMNEVFNRTNDAERRTWDDMFQKRFFSSYIYKEQNVYDRFIENYTKGLNALLESERIKNEIFLFEHDLWEY